MEQIKEILAYDFMHVSTSDPQFCDSVLRDVLFILIEWRLIMGSVDG